MRQTLRLLFWSLVAGTAGAGVLTALAQVLRLLGGKCNSACRLSVTLPTGFMAGLLVIAMLEHDRRARERSLEP